MSAGETDLATLVQATAALPNGTFSVTVVEGPDRVGVTCTLDGAQPGKVLVGTSPSCSLQLADPQVSRRHLALELEGNTLRLHDLGSTNGTLVGTLRVRDATLTGGETIRVGQTMLRVDYDPAGVNPEVEHAESFGRVRGESRAMRRLYPLCRKLAESRVPVLIEGETGTGKEVLAEALHEEGPWADRPYVVFDCTAVPANLIESELFGHERGAFTGATQARRGVFEQAHGGTLLIDEIGDLELPLQAKLLRAVSRGEIRRVGSERSMRCDVRLICATRRDLDVEVQAGRFRDDLFHRLAVARIELPPLRERHGDVRLIAASFWRELGGVGAPPDAVMRRWEQHTWPGNVRELRNAVERAVALGDEDFYMKALEVKVPLQAPPGPTKDTAQDVRSFGYLESVVAEDRPWPDTRARVLEQLERVYLERILARHGGNISAAALTSGVGRRHLQRIITRRRGS